MARAGEEREARGTGLVRGRGTDAWRRTGLVGGVGDGPMNSSALFIT
jgi:hypothetical protein